MESVSFLNLKGLNPFTRSKRKIRALVFLSIEILATLSIALSFFVNSIGSYSVMDSVTGLTGASQAMCKLVVLLICQDDFVEVVSYLKEFWAVNRFGKECESQIKTIHNTTTKLLKIPKYTLFIAGVTYLVKPFLEKERTLPVSWLSVCSIHTSTTCYVVNYILQCFYAADILVSMVIFDELFFTLLSYGYCELEQIKYAFSIVKIRKGISGDEPKVLQGVVKIIKHHNTVLEYIDKVDKLFNMVLLCQFSTSLFGVCTGLFMLTYEGLPPKLNSALRNIPYVIGVLCQIFIYCVAGQKISEQSESIADAAFEMQWWVKSQPQLRRAICLIMQRAYKRKRISAGGIWILDMNTFVAIVKGSLSLLTFVQAVYIPK